MALVAQWIEHRFPKPGVGGSIPPGGTTPTSVYVSVPPSRLGTAWGPLGDPMKLYANHVIEAGQRELGALAAAPWWSG
jgi:hypothetical protein